MGRGCQNLPTCFSSPEITARTLLFDIPSQILARQQSQLSSTLTQPLCKHRQDRPNVKDPTLLGSEPFGLGLREYHAPIWNPKRSTYTVVPLKGSPLGSVQVFGRVLLGLDPNLTLEACNFWPSWRATKGHAKPRVREACAVYSIRDSPPYRQASVILCPICKPFRNPRPNPSLSHRFETQILNYKALTLVIPVILQSHTPCLMLWR